MKALRLLCALTSFCFLERVFGHTVTADDIMNRCLDSNTQKSRPSKETNLYGLCSPWKDNSCCNDSTAKALQTNSTWMNLDWNHCEGRTLPDACNRHFLLDLCFYECSPNKGPWIQKEVRRFRKDRFVGIPLCESACIEWWEDCKTAYTCLQRWDQGFDWKTGTNKCPEGSTCNQFDKVFGNSVPFCENLWGGSWKVVPDTEPCMKLDFTGPNPNVKVARARAEEIASGAVSINSHFRLTAVSALLCIISVMLS